MQNILHNQRKKDRGHVQIARWEAIERSCHDPESMAEALFLQWPQQLPKPVLRRIGRAVKRSWAEMRAEYNLANMVEDDEILKEFLRQETIKAEAIDRHLPLSEKIMTLAQSLPDVLSLTCSLVHPDDINEPRDEQRALDKTWSMAEVCEPSEARQQFLLALCLSLAGAGGLIVRQQLKLRVQIPDEQGVMVWRLQERVYAIQFLMGEVTLMTDREARHVYTFAHDTGEPLPLPAGTSYGDMKAYARQKKVSFDTLAPTATVH